MMIGDGEEGDKDGNGDFACSWKCDAQGNCVLQDGKQVLEFIAVKRADNKMWAIPGVSQCSLCVCVCVCVCV